MGYSIFGSAHHFCVFTYMIFYTVKLEFPQVIQQFSYTCLALKLHSVKFLFSRRRMDAAKIIAPQRAIKLLGKLPEWTHIFLLFPFFSFGQFQNVSFTEIDRLFQGNNLLPMQLFAWRRGDTPFNFSSLIMKLEQHQKVPLEEKRGVVFKIDNLF